jgi:hypothetical protein
MNKNKRRSRTERPRTVSLLNRYPKDAHDVPPSFGTGGLSGRLLREAELIWNPEAGLSRVPI